MTAPDTNIEKQKRRHLPVLLGFAGVAVLVVVFAMSFAGGAVDDDGENIAPAAVSESG
ncbi:hypothetical protein [Roseovarius sp. 2305UL8-3]|uniref:hypothetical protein n=1 Tax=Roseovarius conchicola TaxID=3121636 RepID=UPI003526CED2